MSETTKGRHPFYKKSWFRILLLLFFISTVLIGCYGYRVWTAAQKAYEPPKRAKSEKRVEKVNIAEDPVALLLLGVDERPGDVGRSDTIVIATIHPDQKTVILTNIPRDTYVKIPGYKHKTKINHSYAYGGVDLTRQTVEEFLDFPIDGYVKVNMQGLEKIVDELGGIQVDVPMDFIYQGIYFKKGKMTLNGKEALAFARMRKADPEGDLGRIRRQQEVIRGIIHKGTQFSSLTKLDRIMEQLGSHIKTDIPPLTLFNLQRIYANVKDEDIQSVSFQGTNERINGVYYYLVSQDEIKRVHDLLAKHIGYDSPTKKP